MVHVFCFGNLLHGDDGFGIYVHRLLVERLCPGQTKLIEVGIRGIDALGMIDRPSRLILVDALRDQQSAPGTVRVVDGDELCRDQASSVHGGGVGWFVKAIRASVSPVPRVTLIGAVVSEVQGFVPHLSPVLAERLNEVAVLVESLVHGSERHE